MIRKNIIFAVLATFCLTTILFTVIPVGSYGTYDPWLDSPSEDGKIDARDVAPVAAAYGSTGNPTKNVNVTNFPSTYDANVMNFPAEYNMNVTNFPLDEDGNLLVKEQTTTNIYTDAVEITILEPSTRLINGTEYGCPASLHGPYFAFSPKQKFLNVTRFSFMVMGAVETNTGWTNYGFDAYINNQFVYTDTLQVYNKYTDYKWVLVNDPDKCSLINPGINRITIDFGSPIVYLQKIVMLIEYEYQA